MNERDIEQLRTAARLIEMGVAIRSPELNKRAEDLKRFNASNGNRAMRRAAQKQERRKS